MIRIIGMRDEAPDDAAAVIDVTSRSTTWSRGLSPFLLGPCELWGGHVSKTMENAWQYSKIYPEHVTWTQDGQWLLMKSKWLPWALEGWNNPRGVRHPMGKGALPLGSYWETSPAHLPIYYQYVPARKDIYIPLYSRAVLPTAAFAELRRLAATVQECGTVLALRDFDGYDHHAFGMTLEQVVDNPHKTMGHAFVLALMLEREGIT